MYHEHDRKLAAIQEWFTALEPDIAELAIEPSPYNDGFTHVDIRPKRTPDAAEILLRINQEHGWVFLYAGGVRDDQPDDWPDLTFLNACEAIMAGRLTDTIKLWRGKEVARSGYLRMSDEATSSRHHTVHGCANNIVYPLAKLSRRIEKRVVHYPPY